jgi:hypothetical protein
MHLELQSTENNNGRALSDVQNIDRGPELRPFRRVTALVTSTIPRKSLLPSTYKQDAH